MRKIKRFRIRGRIRGSDRLLRVTAGQAKAREVAHLFEESPKLKNALRLFEKKRVVSVNEMGAACPGAFNVFSNNGVLSGKGGKSFALSHTGQALLQKFAPPFIK